MSELGRAVAEKLKDSVPNEDVESILLEAGVSTSATVPTPVRLRVLEVAFSGEKRLEAPDGTVTEVPFDFSWALGPGLYVVGSHDNLHGKSSVLEIIRWALRGRSRVQADVQSWLRHVLVVFQVNDEHVIVGFDVVNSEPRGSVYQEDAARSGRVELARFGGEDAFEKVMDSVMMDRLHLQPIASWVEDQAVEHAWPAYAGALSISSRGLEQLLGDVHFGGMASRLLQMFVGAAWAASRAQAGTAVKSVDAALDRLKQQSAQQEEASRGKRVAAAAEKARAEATLAELPDGGTRLAEVDAAVERAAKLGSQVAALRVQLDGVREAERGARRELREEEARKHALLEDALGRRFFNALRPSACPRCAAPVTEERRAQESEGHECSVCTTHLDLEALKHDVLVAASAPAPERAAALAGAAMLNGETAGAQEETPTEGEAALRQALTDASQRAEQVATRLRELEGERTEAANLARVGGEVAGLLERRRAAELAIARAQGALEALQPTLSPEQEAERAALELRRKVLKAAEAVTTERVKDAQRDVLTSLSQNIADLARDFGIPQLTSVELGGGATLKVHKGGVYTPYGKCTPGEQLRLKVATAVALLRAGFASQTGRHPGLLTVDSPGSEEATKVSLDAMLRALQQAAAEAPDMQVIVATTRTEMLEELVPPERRRVAGPDEYLW